MGATLVLISVAADSRSLIHVPRAAVAYLKIFFTDVVVPSL